MADLDLERAKKLLKSARDLFNKGDVQGVAGLAYQAFESANIALLGLVTKLLHYFSSG